jgi:hypothetical protein
MDNAVRTRQRVLAIFLPVTAVLYISAEALSPKGGPALAGSRSPSQPAATRADRCTRVAAF